MHWSLNKLGQIFFLGDWVQNIRGATELSSVIMFMNCENQCRKCQGSHHLPSACNLVLVQDIQLSFSPLSILTWLAIQDSPFQHQDNLPVSIYGGRAVQYLVILWLCCKYLPSDLPLPAVLPFSDDLEFNLVRDLFSFSPNSQFLHSLNLFPVPNCFRVNLLMPAYQAKKQTRGHLREGTCYPPGPFRD